MRQGVSQTGGQTRDGDTRGKLVHLPYGQRHHGVAFVVVTVQKVRPGMPFFHQSQSPAQVEHIEDADVQSQSPQRAMDMRRFARQGKGDVRLAAAGRELLEILEISGLGPMFEVWPDVAAAVARFDPPAVP